MSTRKELIVNKIVALEKTLEIYVDKKLFPSLDEIDVADLVFYITFTFVGLNDTISMGEKVKELIVANNVTITDENQKKVVPLVIDFIMWLRVL